MNGRSRMAWALRAEWTKLWTGGGGTWWLLFGVVALTVAVSAASSALTFPDACPRTGCLQDPVKISLTGVAVGQVAVAMLAILAVSGEYATGMIRTTLTALPRRSTLLAAKAAVVTGPILATAVAAVLGALAAGRLLLPGNGFTPEHGYPPLSLTDGPTLRAAAGSVLYLVLIGLLSLGVGVMVRDSAAAIGVTLGLLFLPLLLFMIPDADLRTLIFRVTPMNAGLAIQVTRDLASWPISPWAGLSVMTAWAGAGLLGGGLLLRHRDA
ncbi:ABC transporter permease [Nonomuraea sediminis]|uniref:ABC transporter permease n=1 Tax=Nonomuraea sediminis TaxID=2835864 RepID=UPI00202AA9DA|nr:ABC transporter permease [Nonomuraea sediminis]